MKKRHRKNIRGAVRDRVRILEHRKLDVKMGHKPVGVETAIKGRSYARGVIFSKIEEAREAA